MRNAWGKRRAVGQPLRRARESGQTGNDPNRFALLSHYSNVFPLGSFSSVLISPEDATRIPAMRELNIRGFMNRIRYSAAYLFASFAFALGSLHAQAGISKSGTIDSDHDGLSDALESALLARFAPIFMIAHDDCSVRPAQFISDNPSPTVIDDDGTIYGLAFPRKDHAGEVELHYYHLWRKDCGEMGHRLDTEHVSALIELGTGVDDSRAIYWYAAAHEDTICDASQLTRATTLHAEDHGATVWISEGKHASFLSEVLCTHGCGGDRCEQMEPLKTRQIINLGEMGAPMNGIIWLASPEWPLSDKLQRTDFTDQRVARVQRSPGADVVWANPSKRPAEAAILGANAGIGGAAIGARSTDTALVIAHTNTSSALDQSASETGHALKSSSRNVWKALKKSMTKTGQILDGAPR
jgi:hypothetical protein